MRRHRENRGTYTKRAVKALLIIGVINGSVPYILSAFGRDPVSDLGIAWVTGVVAVMVGYMGKAYFETKQERKQDLEDYKVKEIDNEQRISD